MTQTDKEKIKEILSW